MAKKKKPSKTTKQEKTPPKKAAKKTTPKKAPKPKAKPEQLPEVEQEESVRLPPMVKQMGRILKGERESPLNRRVQNSGRRQIPVLQRIEDQDPHTLNKFYEAIAAGASFRAAAGFLDVLPDTVSRWYQRGKEAKSGPYHRFYKMVTAKMQLGTSIAEMKVAQSSPLVYLTKGPGRMINPEWSENPDRKELIQVEQQTNVEVTGQLQVNKLQIHAALGEISQALPGIKVEELIRPQALIASDEGGEEGVDDGGFEDDDTADNRGTNYLGEGNYISENLSLPSSIRESVKSAGVSPPRKRVPVDKVMLETTAGEVVNPQETLKQRLLRLAGRK